MNRMIIGILFSMLMIFQVYAAEPVGEEIVVKDGKAVYKGVSYPVYQGVESISPTPEDSVYAGGVTYSIEVESRKEAKELADKIVEFYGGKKIGTVTVTAPFSISEYERESYYSSYSTEEGKSVSIMLVASEEMVSVLIIPM